MQREKVYAGLIVLGSCAVALMIVSTDRCDAACQAALGGSDQVRAVPPPDLMLVDPERFQEGYRAAEGAVLIDLRTPEEYARGHIDNAILIDYYAPDFLSMLGDLDRETTYYIYCNSGNRSADTLRYMRDLGFQRVYELAGGIQAWQVGGYPIARDR